MKNLFRPIFLIVSLFVLSSSLSSCKTVPSPEPGTPTADAGAPTAFDCIKDVGNSAIADAVKRINPIVASGGAKDVIYNQLESLAADMIPAAFACGLQYIAEKFKADATATGDTKFAVRRDLARGFIEKKGYIFSSPSPVQ